MFLIWHRGDRVARFDGRGQQFARAALEDGRGFVVCFDEGARCDVEHHAEDRVEPGEDVGPDDLGDRPAGRVGNVVRAAFGPALLDLQDVPEEEWNLGVMCGGVWTIFPHVSIASFQWNTPIGSIGMP